MCIRDSLRPDLWGAIIAAVPFVDVLNTMSDTTLPLTPPEWPEWGNPIEDAQAYDRIASYSPYDQVRPQAYPPILATGGLSDPRVTYWRPATAAPPAGSTSSRRSPWTTLSRSGRWRGAGRRHDRPGGGRARRGSVG